MDCPHCGEDALEEQGRDDTREPPVMYYRCGNCDSYVSIGDETQ